MPLSEANSVRLVTVARNPLELASVAAPSRDESVGAGIRRHSRLNQVEQSLASRSAYSVTVDPQSGSGTPTGGVALMRFKSELGYKHAAAWPIYRRRGGGQAVYYMIGRRKECPPT